MKRILFICAALIGFLGISFFVYTKVNPVRNPASTENTPVQSSTVSVKIDTNTGTSTVPGVVATNAFDALTEAVKSRDLELKTKQYDFGVFVEQIGTLANTKDKSWIYFVNGKAGTVAADKQTVKGGDTVEWRYKTPTSE